MGALTLLRGVAADGSTFVAAVAVGLTTTLIAAVAAGLSLESSSQGPAAPPRPVGLYRTGEL